MQPTAPMPARTRVAELRLPSDLPPRDLERLAAVSSTAAPHAPASAPASYGLNAPKFGSATGGDGSPADVRVFGPTVAPLLMRNVGVVSTGHVPHSALVLPNLSIPHSSPPASLSLPPVSRTHSATSSEPVNAGLVGAMSAMSLPHPTQPLPPSRTTTPNLHLPRSTSTHHPFSTASPSLPHRTSHTSAAAAAAAAAAAPVTSPTNPSQLSPNEIKKAQNRKSAKRFREAQKQRWKNMADDLLLHKKTISELRSKLADQEACVRRANAIVEGASAPKSDPKRSAMSINDLVDSEMPVTSPLTPPPVQAHVEAEATLYAQILSNTAQKSPADTPPQPYVSEIGLLQLCYVVVSTTSRVVSIRRGSPTSFGTFAVDGLSAVDANEFRNALTCGKPVAVAFSRHGVRINAVMNPVEGSDRVVVAEFSPLH